MRNGIKHTDKCVQFRNRDGKSEKIIPHCRSLYKSSRGVTQHNTTQTQYRYIFFATLALLCFALLCFLYWN